MNAREQIDGPESQAPEDFDLTRTNPHYVRSVMELTNTRDVVAIEDVYDSRGVKLIAKGTKVDESLHERLVRFKLRKPLETSLEVEGGVSASSFADQAKILLDEIPPLAILMKPPEVWRVVMAEIRGIELDRVGTLLSTIEQDTQNGGLRHSTMALVTSLALAVRLRVDPTMLPNVALAAVLHDAGELYISPEIRNPKRQLTPAEWKHIAAHPRIGQLVIEETTKFPKAVAMAISEHHERANGFSYPRRIDGLKISRPGQILMVSELLCGIFARQDHLMERACLAVKVIPGEYPREIVSLIATIQHEFEDGESPGGAKPEEMVPRVHHIQQLIDEASEAMKAIMANHTACKHLQDRIHERLLMLRSALHSTGLFACETLGNAADGSGDLALEIEAVVYEIEWRLRELSRQIYLSLEGLPEVDRDGFGGVVEALSTV